MRPACRKCGGPLRDGMTPKGHRLRWCPACHSKARKIWKSAHPGAERAHRLVARAIQTGVLARQPCAVCGDPHSEFHHDAGYTDALRGVFLCRTHHRQAHRKGRG